MSLIYGSSSVATQNHGTIALTAVILMKLGIKRNPMDSYLWVLPFLGSTSCYYCYRGFWEKQQTKQNLLIFTLPYCVWHPGFLHYQKASLWSYVDDGCFIQKLMMLRVPPMMVPMVPS